MALWLLNKVTSVWEERIERLIFKCVDIFSACGVLKNVLVPFSWPKILTSVKFSKLKNIICQEEYVFLCHEKFGCFWWLKNTFKQLNFRLVVRFERNPNVFYGSLFQNLFTRKSNKYTNPAEYCCRELSLKFSINLVLNHQIFFWF